MIKERIKKAQQDSEEMYQRTRDRLLSLTLMEFQSLASENEHDRQMWLAFLRMWQFDAMPALSEIGNSFNAMIQGEWPSSDWADEDRDKLRAAIAASMKIMGVVATVAGISLDETAKELLRKMREAQQQQCCMQRQQQN